MLSCERSVFLRIAVQKSYVQKYNYKSVINCQKNTLQKVTNDYQFVSNHFKRRSLFGYNHVQNDVRNVPRRSRTVQNRIRMWSDLDLCSLRYKMFILTIDNGSVVSPGGEPWRWVYPNYFTYFLQECSTCIVRTVALDIKCTTVEAIPPKIGTFLQKLRWFLMT